MTVHEERPLAAVLQDIFGNLQDIVRSEVRLAAAEIKTETTKAVSAATPLAAGGVLLLYAGGFMLLAAVYGLSQVVQPWLAALIVAVATGMIGGIFTSVGKSRLRLVKPVPEKAIQSVKENVQWLKNQTK